VADEHVEEVDIPTSFLGRRVREQLEEKTEAKRELRKAKPPRSDLNRKDGKAADCPFMI
jgi:hypothetical protein